MEDATPERWLAVPGYEGLYEVSDLGRVRSFRKSPGRILRPHTIPVTGYQRVTLSRPGEPREQRWYITIHQLVLLAFVGPCPEGCESRHLDDVPANNRLSNLAHGTRSENRQDAKRNGIRPVRRKPLNTHCPSNHLFDEANTRYEKSGGRKCRKCDNERHKQAYWDKRAKAA